jgi:hypothetical protein
MGGCLEKPARSPEWRGRATLGGWPVVQIYMLEDVT